MKSGIVAGIVMSCVFGIGMGVGLALMGTDVVPSPQSTSREVLQVQTGNCDFPATIKRVIDGDTYEVTIRTWENRTAEFKIRLLGADTPELRPRKGTPEEKAAEKIRAQAATDFVVQAFEKSSTLYFRYGWKTDNFGRPLGTIMYYDGTTFKDIVVVLLEEGHAEPWSRELIKDDD